MSSRELSEWMAYSELEPFGEGMANLRAGIIASTVANFSYSRPSEPTKPSDFIPDFMAEQEDPDEVDRIEKMKANMERLRIMTGGQHVHRGEVVS